MPNFRDRPAEGFEGILIRKVSNNVQEGISNINYAQFRHAVSNARIPSLTGDALLDESLDKRLIYMAFNNKGFCGTIATHEQRIGYWRHNNLPGKEGNSQYIRGSDLHDAKEILGAYAPENNKVPNLISAMADCVLDEIAKGFIRSGKENKKVTAIILGQGSVPKDDPNYFVPSNYNPSAMMHISKLCQERYIGYLLQSACRTPELLGEIHSGAVQAAKWAESNNMTAMGYDPECLGPVFEIEAKNVKTTYHFFEAIPGSVPQALGITKWKRDE